MPRLSTWDWVALALLIVGGLNWGLIGLFTFDLIAAILGDMSVLARIVYILVGIAAIWMAIEVFRWRAAVANSDMHRERAR